MKKLLLFIIFYSLGLNLFADTLPTYELTFLQYEKKIIINNNLISKQQALENEYNSLVVIYPKIDKNKLTQMIDNAEIILVEDITPEDIRNVYFVQYFYSIQVKSENQRILSISSINAKTGKTIGGIIMDDQDTSDFIYFMNKNEIIKYAKQYVAFTDESKLNIQAVYDYGFYYGKASATYSGYWKYRITIDNGKFTSSAFPDGINTIFITPFVRGFAGKREEPEPDNEIGHLFTHRLYTYNTKQTTDKAASKSAEAPAPEAKYIGLD